VPYRFDGAYLTLSADAAVQAAQVLGARAVVPVHFEGWAHFTQGADDLRSAFAAAGIGDRLMVAEPGASVAV
jgi:L-ascorbate metabolism protein UlaG (beta-lactamase superfamily)